MTTIGLDPVTHDLAVVNNQLQMLSNADEVTQNLRTRLKMFLGEWFLDLFKGVPYREEILGKGNSDARIGAAIKKVILETPGVIQLMSYSQTIDAAARKLSVEFRAQAADGAIIDFSEVIP